MKDQTSESRTKVVRQLQEKPAKNEFLIVGIGASAGGVMALQEFFRHAPVKSGIAYVVILHLSPDYDSQLTAVLQRETKIPTTQVTAKVRIRPDHIYVVPPHQHLMIEEEHITVTENVSIQDRRAPVDIFFRSLADEHGPRSIAVILSGTGADGSMGLKRIKERGGACFVQNPREAEFNEMPRNAIASDLVDEILPVAEIATKIISYRNSIGTVEITEEPEDRTEEQQQALREIFTQLRMHTGHDFSNYKRPTLLRRIERRINVRNLTDLPAYSKYLHDNPEETTALLKDLLISVTNFFRDKKPFDVIRSEVLPILFNGKSGEDQVRIWVPGCATGEEAYSLAMLCAEINMGTIDGPKIQIFATDIDEAAITTAREGLYTLNDTADVSPERLRLFFTRDGDRFRIRREIRETIMFAVHNVLKDPPFSHLDMVSCRNLMIYLNSVAKERVIETFHFSLNPGGYLFLGTSESVDGASDLYAIYNRDSHIFQRRQVNIKSYPVPESTPLQIDKFRKDAATQEQEQKLLERISFGDLHQQLLEEYAPPSLVVNEEYDILHLTERAGQFLQIVGGELTKNLLKLIKPELRLELRSALYQSTQRQTAVEARGLKVIINDKQETVNIHVRPVLRSGDTAKGFILIVFEPAAEDSNHEILLSSDEPIAQQLEEELIKVKAQLRASNEQHDFQAEEMKASNEELQAMNEELRSAAEELETSREELQSINEELRTVNQELKVKIEETSVANNNLQNLINSTDIGTIFLDRSFRVALYTPAAGAIFNLIPADYGRPLTDITHKLEYQNLLSDAETVLEKLNVVEKEVSTHDDYTYLMRLTPYRTDEDRINGVVITFVDITERKRNEKALRAAEENYRTELQQQVEQRTKELKESRDQYQTLVENTPDVITRWDKKLRLVYANTAFEKKTGVSNELMLGKTNAEMGQPKTYSSAYSESLKRAFEQGVTVEHFNTFPTPDGEVHFHTRMTPELNLEGEIETILAIARDITDIRKAEQEVESAREFLKSVLDSSLDVIQVLKAVRDESGKITDFTWVVNNRKAVEQNGGDVIGESLLKLNPGTVPSGVFDRMVEVTETGVVQVVEQFYSSEQFEDSWFYQSMVQHDDGIVMTTRDITAQIKAERELLALKDELAARANDKYYQLFNSIDEGYCIVEVHFDKKERPIDFEYREVNPAFEKQIGISNATGKTILELVPNIEQKWFDLYGRVAKTGEPIRCREHSAALNRYLDLYAFRVGAPEDNQVAVIFTDISEHKLAEEALRHSEERLRVTMESALDFVIITMDINGNIEQWNTGAERILEYSSDEAKGQKIEIIYTEEDRAAGVPQIELATAVNRGHAEDERWHTRKDGSRLFMSGITRPIYNPQLTGFVKVARDMTDHQHAQEQVRLFEERYRIALESAGMAAWDWNIKENVIEWNQNHYTLLGIPLNDSNKDIPYFLQYVHPEDRDFVLEELEHAVETAGVFNDEFRIIRRDNDAVLWMKGYGSTLSHENGRATRMVGVMFDITEQKLFTEELSRKVNERTMELQRSNDDLRQFAHVASHDLKEPVRKIRTFSRLLMSKYAENLVEEAKWYLGRIDSATDRMYGIIEGVFNFSKLTANAEPLQKIDLDELLEQIEGDLELVMAEKQAKITRKGLPSVIGNRVLIYQLFYNLILNSLKFSQENKPSRINLAGSATEEDHVRYWQIKLSDNGIGFDQEHAEDIFNPFARLNSADLYEGSGLGLALCKKIIERHDGFISANAKPYEGAEFTILLPMNPK
ncbi:MAG TPA: PAS domain S-box protein [Flavobacterium sp.]|jgi:PAS domain S-box-containing protein